MRVHGETQLVQFHDWALRVRPAEGQPARLLLLLHGWTGDENSMWVFVRKLPRNYWMMAPRAPHASLPSGYSWRVLPPDRTDGPGLEDLRSSAEGLIALVDGYRAQQNLPGGTFDVMGFSQGAAVASTLALLFAPRIGRVGLLAGYVPRGAEMLLSPRLLEGKRFFVAHGARDEMVNVEYARQSVQLLEEAGANVTLCEDEVGHKVSAGCLRGLETFFD
ncbi:MAG: alpha/beta fold hydrolase [Chloroflexota bacterium]